MSDKPTYKELELRVKYLENRVKEFKTVEQNLLESERRFRLLYERAPLGYQSLDESGHFIEVNEAWLDTLGYNKEEVIGRSFEDFILPKWHEHFRENFARFKAAGEIIDVVFEMIKKDDSTITVSISGKIGKKRDNSFKQTHCILQDITARKNMEDKLKKVNQQNELILNSAGEGIFGLDTKGRHTFVNPAAAKILGYEPEELIGRKSHSLIHHTKEDGKSYSEDDCPIYHAFNDGKIHHKDNEIFWRKNGSSFPVDYSSTPIFEDGELVGAVVSFMDITFRKRAQEQLRKSEELYRNIYDTAPLAFVIWDCDCQVTDWNIQAEKIFGWSKEEVLGLNFFNFLIPENARPDVDEVVKILLEGNLPNHSINQNLTKKGEVILCEWNNSILYDSEGQVRGAISLALDITERTRTEEELAASEEKYRSLFENANDAIFIIDPSNFTILDANENAFNRLGYSHRELLRLTVKDISGQRFSIRSKQIIKELMENKGIIFEHTQRHKNGKKFPVEVSSKIINYRGRKVIQSFVRDITNRKKDQEKLRESSEKIQHFAYSVAHDLKNPSIVIYGLAKQLNKKFGSRLSEKGRNYCEQIQKSSEQIAALVETINLYISTKERPLCLEEVNPKEVLKIIRDEFSVQINIRQIEMVEPEDIPTIKADNLSVLRVFRNFIDNSLKYGGDNLSKIEVDYKDDDDFHIFSISDDGVGLEKDESKGIFGLFNRRETSKGIEGTGLGLAIVKEIAERHQGEVWIEPYSTKGATFYLSISKNL